MATRQREAISPEEAIPRNAILGAFRNPPERDPEEEIVVSSAVNDQVIKPFMQVNRHCMRN